MDVVEEVESVNCELGAVDASRSLPGHVVQRVQGAPPTSRMRRPPLILKYQILGAPDD